MPVEQLVRAICDVKQSYTQYGGLRPFGVSFLFAGYDRHHGFQLYVPRCGLRSVHASSNPRDVL